jgi:hypothetical protein
LDAYFFFKNESGQKSNGCAAFPFFTPENMKKYCPNCFRPLARRAKFCHHCGQKTIGSHIPVGELVQQVWFKVFHLESRYFRALFRLFIPGQVSIDYFSGKRKRYPPPVQFFFVIMFFFFVVINSDKDFIRGLNAGAASEGDGFNFFEIGRQRQGAHELLRALDTLPDQFQTPQARAVLDSMVRHLYFPDSSASMVLRDTGSRDWDRDSVNMGSFGETFSIREHDLFNLTPDQIVQKYKPQPWYNRILLRQSLKTFRDPEGMLRSYIGSAAWAVFVMVVTGAGVLMLLHVRRKRYYVEHLIFLLHQASADWLFMTLVLLSTWVVSVPSKWLLTLVCVWIPTSIYIAMLRYYRQSKLKTFAKWLIFVVMYVVIGVVMFAAALLVTMLLF